MGYTQAFQSKTAHNVRNTAIFAFWAAFTLPWVLSVTTWKAATLRRYPPGSMAWWWLRAFGLRESDQNRSRFLNLTAIIGIAFVTLSTAALLWLRAS